MSASVRPVGNEQTAPVKKIVKGGRSPCISPLTIFSRYGCLPIFDVLTDGQAKPDRRTNQGDALPYAVRLRRTVFYYIHCTSKRHQNNDQKTSQIEKKNSGTVGGTTTPLRVTRDGNLPK